MSIILKKISYPFMLARSIKEHRALTPPRWVQIEIINNCNLKCKMCDRWLWASEESSTSHMLSTDKLCRLLQELSEMNVSEVRFTGGEPLLRKDFPTLVNRVKELGMSLSIFTNGTLMSSDNIMSLSRANAKVIFSIDGYENTHDVIRGLEGTYDKVIKGINNLLLERNTNNKKCKAIVNYTVQRDNINSIIPFALHMDEVGVDEIWFDLAHGQPKVSPGKAKGIELTNIFSSLNSGKFSSKIKIILGDTLSSFMKQKIPQIDVDCGLPVKSFFKDNTIPCLAAYKSCLIDNSGRVFPCCFCFLDNYSYNKYEKIRERFVLGNITESSFQEIWHGDKYNKFRKETDPVNIDSMAQFCGQCCDYLQFKKVNKYIKLYNKYFNLNHS